MITDNYIDKNRTSTFNKGETVVMHTCGEAVHYDGKIWECQTDSFGKSAGEESVFLIGFSGSFNVKYLQRVKL